ncbi:MAG: hypothetical protein ACXVFV_00295 [Mycobacteriales bacterium]
MSAWETALDALEEWLRRTAEGLRSRDLALPPPPAALPTTPVPAALQVRAQAVLAAMATVEAAGQARRERLVRERAYAG